MPARLVVVGLAPLVTYGVARPLSGSDSAGLAAAGAVPLIYTIVLAVLRRRADVLGVASAVSFSLGCLVSLLARDSSLPLKLHEAAVTFLVGVALLVAVVVRRPPPISRLVRLGASRSADTTLSALTGAFLVLHALLHVLLAVTLPTGSFLVTGRAVDWGTAGLALVALRACLRRTATTTVPEPSASCRSRQGPNANPRPWWRPASLGDACDG